MAKSMKDYMYKRASMSLGKSGGGDDPKSTKPAVKPAKNQGYVEHRNKVMEDSPRAIGGLTTGEIKEYDKNVYKPKQKEWQKMVDQGKLTKSQMKDSVNYYKPDKTDLKKITPAKVKTKKKMKVGIGLGNNPFW